MSSKLLYNILSSRLESKLSAESKSILYSFSKSISISSRSIATIYSRASNLYASYSINPVIIALSSLDSLYLLVDVESLLVVAKLLEVSSRISKPVIFVSELG